MRIKFSLVHANRGMLFQTKEEATTFAQEYLKPIPHTISYSPRSEKWFIAQYENGQLVGILEKQNA